MYRILFLAVMFVGCSPGRESKIKLINPEDIVLTDLKGQSINLSDYKEKTIFVNFWATWCRPCLQEMPTLANAQNKLKNESIVFLFASNESLDQIVRFEKKQGYGFLYAHLGNMEELNILALPTTYIFNKNGELRFSEPGFRTWDSPENIQLITQIVNEE